MSPNPPPCSFIQRSTAGSRTTAPLNRSNSLLIAHHSRPNAKRARSQSASRPLSIYSFLLLGAGLAIRHRGPGSKIDFLQVLVVGLIAANHMRNDRKHDLVLVPLPVFLPEQVFQDRDL